MTAGRDGAVVVLGAGHNGLAAAAKLARAGRRVRVLERRDRTGGVAALEEFHPGFRVPGIQHGTLGLRRRVVDELELASHGLRLRDRPAPTLAAEPDGPGLLLRPGEDAVPEGLAARSPRDAEAWARWREELAPLRAVVGALVDAPPPAVRGSGWNTALQLARPGLALRRLGADAIGRVLRAAPMCAEDLLADLFEDQLLRAFLASRGIEGGFLGPRSSGSGALLLLRELAGGPGAVGGPVAVTDALEKSAREAGAEIELSTEVCALSIEDGRVSGVETADGRMHEAGLVLSGLGARRTFELCRGALPVRLRRAAAGVRARGTTAAVHLALSEPLAFRGHEDRELELVRTARTTVELERAFDGAKHRRPVESPWLDVALASAERPDLAPEGAASVSVLVHHAPANLDGGWTDERRDALREAVLEALEPLTPGVRGRLLGAEVLAPPDLEERYGLDGGHPMHAELGLDQLWIQRPSVRLARYRTGIEGLVLASRAAHPGGELIGSAGLLAAEAALGQP